MTTPRQGSHDIQIGEREDGPGAIPGTVAMYPVRFDLDRLVETRLLIQANSGGGKSWTIRRLLEQSHGKIQHLVIDPEGEFATLRERFDYVLAARRGGDTAVEPRIAPLLAERLLELQASAILDIYELKKHERIAFVRGFLDALVNAPKALWHPVLVVIDEADVFCPEAGKAESHGAVVDLATRGRKRGFCAVLATQRIAKLAKDAAAECNNKLIGRTGLDIDVRRAADELGFAKERWRELRELPAGRFFGFGPALSREVVAVDVGPVETTHPKAGARIAAAPPPAPDRVRAMLPKLADLPAEAEERQRSIEDLRRDLALARRRVTELEKAKPAPAPPPAPAKPIEVPVLKDGQLGRLEKLAQRLAEVANSTRELSTTIALDLRRIGDTKPVSSAVPRSPLRAPAAAPPPVPVRITVRRPADELLVGQQGLTGPAQRILNALAELQQLGITRAPRIQVALFAGYTHTASKGFANAVGTLSSSGLVHRPGPGDLALTPEGERAAEWPDVPRSSDELQARVIGMVGGAAARILRPLLAAYPDSIARDELVTAAGYTHAASKGFANTLGRLSTLGIVRYPARGTVAAADVLFVDVDRHKEGIRP